MVNKYQKGN